MDLEKALDRVRKLVALSSSSNEEEARSSAYLACRLIREHSLEIVIAAARASSTSSSETPSRSTKRPTSSRSRNAYDEDEDEDDEEDDEDEDEEDDDDFGFDWDSYDAGRVPEGEYDLEVMQAYYERDRSGRHTVRVKFAVRKAHRVKNQRVVGRTIDESFFFTQSTAFRVKSFAGIAEVYLPNTVNRRVLEQWAADVIGTWVRGAVRHRYYRGRVYTNVDRYYRCR